MSYIVTCLYIVRIPPTKAREVLSSGVWLARGKHPLPLRNSRPGKAPTSGPPEVLCPRGAQGFGNLPKDRPGLGETTYTTSESSLRTNGVLFPNTQVGWGSYLLREVSPPRSGLCRIYILCGLLRQTPQSTKTLIHSFTLFRIFRSLSPLL